MERRIINRVGGNFSRLFTPIYNIFVYVTSNLTQHVKYTVNLTYLKLWYHKFYKKKYKRVHYTVGQ